MKARWSAHERSGYAYFSFDDEAVKSGATADQLGFVAHLPLRAILDEVHHGPHLFMTLKAAIDPVRRPRRFLLTGSTNVLLRSGLSDSLAGRMAVVRLHMRCTTFAIATATRWTSWSSAAAARWPGSKSEPRRP